MNLLQRVGGIFVAPRQTLASVPSDVGTRDGVVLLAAYLLAVGVPELGHAIADVKVFSGLAAVQAVLGSLLPLLPWLVGSVVLEWVLGASRSHRAALCLTPLLLIHASARLSAHIGWPWPGPEYLPALVGGLAAVTVALWARPQIPQILPDAAAPPITPRPGPRSAVFVGVAVAVVIVTNAALDVRQLVRHWPTLAALGPGQPAPEFAVPWLAGGTLDRDDLRGQPHLLVFWTTWCGVCSAEMPMYHAIANDHASRNLRVIAINADRDPDPAALVAAYQAEHPLTLPVALDTHHTLVRSFRVRMFPHLVLLNADAQVARVFRGRTTRASLDAAISALPPGP